MLFFCYWLLVVENSPIDHYHYHCHSYLFILLCFCFTYFLFSLFVYFLQDRWLVDQRWKKRLPAGEATTNLIFGRQRHTSSRERGHNPKAPQCKDLAFQRQRTQNISNLCKFNINDLTLYAIAITSCDQNLRDAHSRKRRFLK